MHQGQTGAGALDEAFERAPRRRFLPLGQRARAALDRPLPIGHGQTNSQPSTVRRMLELLDVRPGQRVLDVGSGSGWTTALLAHLVGPGGSVRGVELEPDLVRRSRRALAATGCPWARIEPAEPGALGWPPEQPYDRVLVSAAGELVPQALLDQLGPDALMVLPVAGRLLRVERTGGVDEVHEFGAYRFVPLR